LEHRGGPAQTGGAGLLILEGSRQGDVAHLRGDGASGHGASLLPSQASPPSISMSTSSLQGQVSTRTGAVF